MKTRQVILTSIAVCLLALLLTSCSRNRQADPVSGLPSNLGENISPDSNRDILAVYRCKIDTAKQSISLEPVSRTNSFHFKLTDQYPDIVTIDHYHYGNPLTAEIKLSHPAPGSGIDLYDPRVIAVLPANTGVSISFPSLDFLANHSVVLNPDGYTKLCDDPSIPGNANPFVAYFKQNPYRIWSSTINSSQTLSWTINLNGFGGPMEFLLVVDVSTNYPAPSNPMLDNPPEPVKIAALIGPGLTDDGGSATIDTILTDWQGQETIESVSFESPLLFNGTKALDYVSKVSTYDYRYSGAISNDLLAPVGEYPVLISALDSDTGIRAYNLIRTQVTHSGSFSISDITPQSIIGLNIVDFTMHGNHLFIVGSTYDYPYKYRMQIFDVSDFSKPRFLTGIVLSKAPLSIYVTDNYLYLISKISYTNSRLDIVDISNPFSPVFVNAIDLGKYVTKIMVEGEYLLAMHSAGLMCFDIDPPGDARLLTQVRTKVESFQVRNGFLYITGNWRFTIYEFNPPYYLRWIKSVWDREIHGDFCINGNYACVQKRFGTGSEIKIIDISQPENAFVAGTLANIPYYLSGSTRLLSYGDFLYVLTQTYDVYETLYTYDISNLTDPQLLCTRIDYGPVNDYKPLLEMTQGDRIAYVSGAGIRFVDTSQPSDPRFMNEPTNLSRAYYFCLNGNYLYMVTNEGVQIIDVSTADSPSLAKTIPGDLSWNYRLAVNQDYLFLSSYYDDTIDIYDINSLEDTHQVNSINMNNPLAMAISGNYLIVGGDITIFDISDAVNPELIKTITGIGYALNIDTENGYAGILSGTVPSLYVADIDPPEDAAITGTLPFTDPTGISMSGNFAYVADSNKIVSVDMTDPYNLVKTDTLGITSTNDVIVDGVFAYVSSSHGLTVADISNPYDLQTITSFTCNAERAELKANYSYIIGDGEFKVLKLW